MTWIVIEKVFTNQSFTENKAVINEDTAQIYLWISQRRFTTPKKIHPLRDAASDADCSTPFRILKITTVSLKMDSGNVINNRDIL